jgi:xylulokinase
MPFILAYDVGTSGCKAAVVTTEGRILATAYPTYPTRYPQPLWAEQDPADWWRAVIDSTRQVMEASRAKPADILGLSFSTQMVNVIPVDAQGEPLGACISWLDGRAWEEARKVMGKLGGPSIFGALFGTAITGKDLIPKYLWLKRNDPERYKQAAAFIDASGYLLARATGRLAYEWSVASVTGMFNLKKKTWDTGLMRFLGLDPEKFPDLVQSAEQVGGLTEVAAQELGLLVGTPVFGGAGDAMTAALGSGACCDGEAHLCLGTSGFVGLVTARRVNGRRGLVSIQSADPHKLLLVGEMETAGACLKWAARQLYGCEPDAAALAGMDEDVDQIEPGAGSLLFTPWMYGERCPVPDESLRAAFINLGANHTREQMARAVYEGVAYNIRWIVELIQKNYGFECEPLRVLGGGARGLPWLHIISDISGKTLEAVANPHVASVIGAAMVAAVGLKVVPTYEDIKTIVPVEHVIEPQASLKPVYDRMFNAYRQVYHSLRGLYHELNREG